MLIELPALGAYGAYRTRARHTLADVTGTPTAELSLVPPVFVHRTMSALRAATPFPADRRSAALAEAGRLFAETTVDGLAPADYDRAVSRVAGLPINEVRAARTAVGARVARAAHSAYRARPVGAAADRETYGAVPSGRGVARCSRCTRPATIPARTACGPPRSRWATGSRCGRRGGSRSRRTA
jgi:hypothetical protein